MAISFKHAFASGKTDGADATLIQPSNWNAEHALTLGAGKVLGRASGSNGAAQELPLAFDSTLQSMTGPSGTTALRPTGTEGAERYNTDTSSKEIFKGGAWKALIDEATQVVIQDNPTGTVLAFAGVTAPANYLFCFGQTASRTGQAALYAILGITYGPGDGTTTFNLPDLRGMVIAGKDDMGGTAANRLTTAGSSVAGATLGATGGSEAVTLTTPMTPVHGHPLRETPQVASSSASGTNGGLLMLASGASVSQPEYLGTVTNTQGQQLGGTGGGGAHPNVQPTRILNYMIRV